MTNLDHGTEEHGTSWASLLWDSRPLDHAFGGSVPSLDDVVLRAVALERRASGPLALVTLQWPDVPAGAPREWAAAVSLRIRLAFHSVTTLDVDGWPSGQRGPLALRREHGGVAASFAGGPVRLSLQAELVGVDGFESQP